MKVNSAKEFRNWIKCREQRSDINENFMGCSHTDGNNKQYGFFNLYHGKKEDIANFLTSNLNMAEDNQAIYEFLQNAVDCGATHFWFFFSEEHFVAINNGEKFTKEGLDSLLNVAQSTKKEATSIGRLGIGFKLVHRLVGKENGIEELMQCNRGPIMFSWGKREEFKQLLFDNKIEYEGLEENPFLLKIAITNFPANEGEVVRDIKYNTMIPFQREELEKMRQFIKEKIGEEFKGSESTPIFDHGTLFYSRLGEGKCKLLESDFASMRDGIEYSMSNTLKQLRNIQCNESVFQKKELHITSGTIGKESEEFKRINPEYANYDIQYTVGFLPIDFKDKSYLEGVKKLKQSPNFYKHFPMGDEVNNMALFVHCDAFNIESNRRKLHNGHANQNILPIIADHIKRTLAEYQETDKEKYLQLYASLLLTNRPTSQEKSWIVPLFHDRLTEVVREGIPTMSGKIATDANQVKIRKVKIDLPLAEIGLPQYEWFAWDYDGNEELAHEATDKLDIEAWNINDIITNANKESLCKWLTECPESDFEAFIGEIKATTTSKKAEEVLPTLNLFRVDEVRVSYCDLISEKTEYILINNKIDNIRDILTKIGFQCTNEPFESHPLANLMPNIDEKSLFAKIKRAAEENWCLLKAASKVLLVSALQTLEGIGEETVCKLRIFKNIEGDACSLNKLISYRPNAESWLQKYVISEEDNLNELRNYMISEEGIFEDIITSEYEDVLNSATIDELYEFCEKSGRAWNSDLTIKLIDKYGARNEEVLSLLEKTLDKGSIKKFIDKIDRIKLSTDRNYNPQSYEYRCLQLAANAEIKSIREKIYINDIVLNYFQTNNEVPFVIKDDIGRDLRYQINLSDILPQDKESAIYGKIKEEFSSMSNCDVIFSADYCNIDNVAEQLKAQIRKQRDLSPKQYAFIILYCAQNNKSLEEWPLNKYYSCKNILSIIEYCYTKGMMPLMAKYDCYYTTKGIMPLKAKYDVYGKYTKNKFLFSDEYTLPDERGSKMVEQWCGNDEKKRAALRKLGTLFNDDEEIRIRKKFKANEPTSWTFSKDPRPFLEWAATISPIKGDYQLRLLNQMYNHYQTIRDFRWAITKQIVLDDAKELDTDKYKRWRNKKDCKVRIFTFNTQIPYHISAYAKAPLCTVFNGEFHYNANERLLYIHKREDDNIVSALQIALNDKSVQLVLNQNDINELCNPSIEEYEKLEKIVEQKNAIIEQQAKENEELKARLVAKSETLHRDETVTQEMADNMKKMMGGEFCLKAGEIISEHTMARYRVLMYIKRCPTEYTLHPDFDEKKYFNATGNDFPIRLKDGRKIYPCSAKFGIWYLHPHVMQEIIENGHLACLCTGNGDNDFEFIKTEKDIRELAEKYDNVILKIKGTEQMPIMDTIKSVMKNYDSFDWDGTKIKVPYSNRGMHLMLMVYETPNTKLNDLFCKAFENNGDCDDI